MICPFSEVANCYPSDCPLWVENEGCAFYVIAKSLLKKQEPPTGTESLSPKPTDPLSIRGVEYVMTECDAKTGTVKYEPRERIEL